MNIIENAIYDLLQKEPFFANFLLGCNVTYNDPRVPTAACMFKKNQIHFIFNVEFMSSLTRETKAAVLKHEIFHVLLDHVSTRSYGPENRMAKNLAMDCAINQYIDHLPKDGVTLSSMSEICKKQLSPYETWEYYYHQLKDSVEDKNQPHPHDAMHGDGDEDADGEGGDSRDGNGGKEARESMRRAIVRDLANKALKASKGKTPNGLSSILSDLNKSGKVNWKQQLRNIVSSARAITTKPNRMRTHRRFELEQPGRKKDKKLILGVCVDSSGSVSDDSFAAFMSEVHNIAKMTTITYLIHADCEVQKVEVITGGKAKKEKLKERHGNGGTAYQPAIDECKKRDCDVIVYLGDMDSADTPTNPGVPFIWVRVGKQDPPGDFGRIIDLD